MRVAVRLRREPRPARRPRRSTPCSQGADCFVIDAESHYENRYGQAREYVTQLRTALGADYPIGLTSFPYVDYHPKVPYSVFLGPGGAQANLPQVYWKDIGDTVDAASAKTVAQNRIYERPIAPIGQTYQSPSPEELQRFRAVWAGYGARGPVVVVVAGDRSRGLVGARASRRPPPPRCPTRAGRRSRKGKTGDQVIWLQRHLAAANPAVAVSGTFDAATERALRDFQTSRGLPATGTTDAATWGEVLRLDPVGPERYAPQ